MPEELRNRERRVATVRTLLWVSLLTLLVASAGIAAAGSSSALSSENSIDVSPTPCVAGWIVQTSPNPDPGRNWFNDVVAFSFNDAWAVGAYGELFNGTQRALIEHWDGTSWSVITGLETYVNTELVSISGLTPNDIWAVGYTSSTDGAFAIHWDGTSWSVIPTPLPPSGTEGVLRGVAAISHNDVWAVGNYVLQGQSYNLTMHWDGAQWNVVPCPTSPTSDLLAVDAVSSDDVWAVGGEGYVQGRTVLMHWDGTTWSASLSTFVGNFFDVAAIASDDVWAVGTYFPMSQYYGIFAHWDGVRWTQYPSLVGRSTLKLAALSSTDIWALGGGATSLTAHWDGTRWTPNLDSYPGHQVHPDARTIISGGIAAIPGRIWFVDSDSIAWQQSTTLVAIYDTTCPTATPVVTSTPIATPTQVPCMSGWTIHDSPNTDRQYDRLYAVDALSSTDVWAVGSSEEDDGHGIEFRDSVTLHWNGAVWDRVPSPNPDSNVILYGVTAIAHDDVWAVGSSGAPLTGMLAIHWNGDVWTEVPLQLDGYLYAVDAVSSNDVWAVGRFDSGSAMALHWDGTMWSQVTIPIPVGVSSLNGVAAISSDDVWAVGYGHEGSYLTTFIVHWDGQQWVRVPTPVVPDRHQQLHSVSGSAADDVWAVGEQGGGALILHWDGTSWTESVINSAYKLFGVLSLTANDAWAFGLASVWHWNGTSWSFVPTPDPYPSGFTLNAGAALSSTEIWAVGSLGFGSSGSGWTMTLTELYTGTCDPPTPAATVTATRTRTPTATRTPTISPTATRTPTSTRTQTQMPLTTATTTAVQTSSATATGTATSTSSANTPTTVPGSTTAPTNTRTNTPLPTQTATVIATTTATVCSLAFSDVTADSAFYPFIRCLACKGIISGYSDGTFRPFNELTRGQIAKMVSNAANINDDPGPQVFEDVDPTQTFYTWINRLANQNIMGGYLCGGEGEPCGENNQPYFRPFANATRGQLAKIVSNAAGVAGTPTGQSYADVSGEHPFYLWIMRLTEQGVMSGYDCGGDGEPCDEANRPYFRPYNNVTRGQASKIVANTFYPNCQTPAR